MSRYNKFLLFLLGVFAIIVLVLLVVNKRSKPNPLPSVRNAEYYEKTVPRVNAESKAASNTFVTKYAGGYTVEVTGYSGGDIESYVLHSNGSAKWMWIVPDASKGARVDSEKSGSWTASEGKIVISIRGNTGTIKEEFKLRGERFYSTNSSDRYLKPTQ